jgi:hypothetical protein
MTETCVTIPSNFRVKSSIRLSTKNALALYVRRRWPMGGVKLAMAEFDLTEWEARTLFDATASLATYDKMLDHHRGGFGLGLTILQIRTQTATEEFFIKERERIRHESEAALARDKRLGEVLSYLRSGPDLAGDAPSRMDG